MKKVLILIMFPLLAFLSQSASADSTSTEISLDLAERVNNFYIWALGIGGMVALGIIIFGGVLYSASGGNPSRMGEAKTWIQSALFGLALLFSSYLLLNFLNPNLTRLQEIFLDPNPQVQGPTLAHLPGGGGNALKLQTPTNLDPNAIYTKGYRLLPPPTDGSYIRGSDGGVDASCGKLELIQVIYTVAQRWKSEWSSNYSGQTYKPVVVRDLNGSVINSGWNHETHDQGVDVDIDVSALNTEQRIRLAKMFIDTGIVTGMIHNISGVRVEINPYFEETQPNLTPWKDKGEFMRVVGDHSNHFHVHIGDGDGGAGTGIQPGPFNTSCTYNTTDNPDSVIVNRGGPI